MIPYLGTQCGIPSRDFILAKTYLILEMRHLKIFFASTANSDQLRIKHSVSTSRRKIKILLRSVEYLLQFLIACFCAPVCKIEERRIYRDKNTDKLKQNGDMPKSWDYSRRV